MVITRRSSRSMLFFFSVLLTVVSHTSAEKDKCSCSPRAFLFKLDLANGTCPQAQVYPASALFDNGVKDYTCRISLSPREPTDADAGEAIIETPRSEPVVNSIQFIEVDTRFNVLHSSLLMGLDLVTGDSFRYTTIQTADVMVGGISIILRGNNGGYDHENVFTITYTNECGKPTFRGGEKIGWVQIANVVPSSSSACGDSAVFTISSAPDSDNAPSAKPSPTSGSIKRTPDMAFTEVLKLAGLGSLFSINIPVGFLSLVEQALAAYYNDLVFDAIYRTTDASKLLDCDKSSNNSSSSSSASKVNAMCGLLSEALCGLSTMIIEGESGIIPTLFPSVGGTTTIGTETTAPPTVVGRPM